jgi:predicted XRE-type DNA-binding protein
MTTETYDSVWDAISETKEEAENMKLRAELMMLVEALIKEFKLTQTRAATLFGVTQPRISDLIRGKLDLFSLDSLVNMLAHAGYRIDVGIKLASEPAQRASVQERVHELAHELAAHENHAR